MKVFELAVNFYRRGPAQISPFHQILQGATICMEEKEKEPSSSKSQGKDIVAPVRVLWDSVFS